jgi:hypothetical protein
MYTLRARQDFLPAQHEVIGVRVPWVFSRWHSVESPRVERVLFENVKVGFVLGSDDSAKVLFVGGTKRVSLSRILQSEKEPCVFMAGR